MSPRWLVLWLLAPALAQAADTWTTPYPGVRFLRRVTRTPNRIFVLQVDLGRRGVRIRATRDRDRNIVTSEFARRYGCALAVNGDFSRLADRRPTGLAVGARERWAGTRDGTLEGFLAVGRDNRALLSPPEEVLAAPEAWMWEVVSGRPLIVDRGVALPTRDCGPHFCARHPRTAVGLSRDGKKLILAVVDGRSTRSRGMTTREMGRLMAEMGAWRALNLDGGGSSTMYVRAARGVVNTPSDGTERRVANHIGVALLAPYGGLRGVVRSAQTGSAIAGARVSTSKGRTTTTGSDGAFRFRSLSVGRIAVTAAAPGFVPLRRSVYISAGDVIATRFDLKAETQATVAAARADAAEPSRDAPAPTPEPWASSGGEPEDVVVEGSADDPEAVGCAAGGAAGAPAALWVIALLTARRRRPAPRAKLP